MIEEYKTVTILGRLYKVSNMGVVKNSKDRIRRPGLVGRHRDRLQMMFQINGVLERVYVHQLVARAFIPNPLNKLYINHIDNNPLNNNASNLEWCTHQENMDHMTKQKRYRNIPRPGVKHHNCKLTETDAQEIRNSSDKQKIIASRYGISQQQVSRIKTGIRWKHTWEGVEFNGEEIVI